MNSLKLKKGTRVSYYEESSDMTWEATFIQKFGKDECIIQLKEYDDLDKLVVPLKNIFFKAKKPKKTHITIDVPKIPVKLGDLIIDVEYDMEAAAGFVMGWNKKFCFYNSKDGLRPWVTRWEDVRVPTQKEIPNELI